MHSFRGAKCTIFHYNSDFSGSVEIYKPNNETIELPASDVVEFIIATYIRNLLKESIAEMIDTLLEMV